jgi:hypothetical protein
VNDPRTPLPVYADCEEMHGRLRRFVEMEWLREVWSRDGHDPGDEDR